MRGERAAERDGDKREIAERERRVERGRRYGDKRDRGDTEGD